MREVDAVFWDVGGVLLNIPSVFAAQTAFVHRLAEQVDKDPEAALESYRGVLREHFRGRENREYRTARAGRAKAVTAILGDRTDAFDWESVYTEEQRRHLELNPGVAETVRGLHEAGIYLGIISDADADRPRTILQWFDLEAYFNDITTSEEVGYTKPDRRMFETALEKAGVRAERSVMIGDKYTNDIEGAASVGMHPIGYGAEPGPLTKYQIDDLTEVLTIVGLNR